MSVYLFYIHFSFCSKRFYSGHMIKTTNAVINNGVLENLYLSDAKSPLYCVQHPVSCFIKAFTSVLCYLNTSSVADVVTKVMSYICICVSKYSNITRKQHTQEPMRLKCSFDSKFSIKLNSKYLYCDDKLYIVLPKCLYENEKQRIGK